MTTRGAIPDKPFPFSLFLICSMFFGPSKFDQLLALMREDRAAQAAQTAAQTTLLTALVESVKAQSEVAREQLTLLTSPPGPPEVRLMTDDIEARYERERKRVKTATTADGLEVLDMNALMAQLGRDILQETA